MTSKKDTRRFSASELRELQAHGESRTDFAQLDALTEAELEDAIACDPAFRDVPADWMKAAEAVMPEPKKLISLRLDPEILEWFKGQGAGYQTRINAVLRSFIEQQNGKQPLR